MEDMDIDEVECQQLLDEFCNTMDTYGDDGFGDPLLVFLAMFLRTTQIFHSWSQRAGSGHKPSTDTYAGWQRLRWKRTRRSERASL